MKKRVLSLVLTICMVLTLMSTVALAADMTALYIGSITEVTLPENGKYIYGGNEGGAGAAADTLAAIPTTATWYLHRDDTLTPKYTLTLNNFAYSGAGYSQTGYGIGIYAAGDLTIELVGVNSVTQAGGSLASYGIYAYGALTIQGSGSLSATGGTVTGDNNSHGIYSSGKITIKGSAQVTATGGSSQKDSYGLAGKSVSIEENAQVTAVAGTAPNSKIGIHGGTEGFTATGGTTMARGGLYAIFTDSSAYITADGMTITGSTDVAADIANLTAAVRSDSWRTIQVGGAEAKTVQITAPATYAYNTPAADTKNGVTATVSFDKNSPQAASTSITATVTLTGTAVAAGTHTIDLTSASDVTITPPSSLTKVVTAALTMTTTDKFVFTFTMPANAVDDLTLTHTFAAKLATPSTSFTATDADKGILSGVANGMKYKIDSGGWVNISSNADIDLTGLSACAISVVNKGDGSTTVDSDAQTITITKATTPTVAGKTDCTTAANNDGTLTGVTTLMEYKKSDAALWTDGTVSDITGLGNGTYYVRVKAAGTALASGNQELVIAAYVTPTPSYGSGSSYNYYTIKAAAGEGGSISSAGGASYREGQDKGFTVTPDEGYIVWDVLVDGVSVGPVSEYEFESIKKRHTIEAVFAKGDMANFKLTGEYAGYPDVDESKWYGTEHGDTVRDATLLGIVEGDSTGFRPEDGVKLSEVVKMAAVVWNTYYGSSYSFDQTEGAHWYDTYVNFAVKYGVIKADDFTDYERNATREEMAYIFAHALPESELAAISTTIPPDVAESDEYGAEIRILYAAGVLCGNDEAGTFTGKRGIIRAEAAAIITRMALPSVRSAE